MSTASRFGYAAALVMWVAVASAPVEAQALADELGAPTTVDVFTPPPCTTPIFNDVPCSNYFSAWINQLYVDQVSTGCPYPNFCPDQYVTRGQMAAFLERTMRGTSSWPTHTQVVWAVKAADGSPDPVASGTALRDAVAAIPTSGPDTPSASNPWLLSLGPGVFNLGGGQLALPPYVNLEGAGQDVTAVQSVNSGATLVVVGTNRVSNLTVADTAVTVVTTAVNLTNGAALTLDHVAIQALHGTGATYGIFSYDSNLNVYDGSVVALGGMGYGVMATGGTPHATQIWRTLFSSGSADVYADSGQAVNLAYARVPDGLANNGGTYKCIGNYDFNLAPVACP